MPSETRILTFSVQELIWAVHGFAERTDRISLPSEIADIELSDKPEVRAEVVFEAGERTTLRGSELAAILILHCVATRVPIPKHGKKTLRVRDGNLEMQISIAAPAGASGASRQGAKKTAAKKTDDGKEAPVTIDVSELDGAAAGAALRSWLTLADDAMLVAPWRRCTEPWPVLLGLIVFDKAPQQLVRGVWKEILQRWPGPESFLSDSRRKIALRTLDSADTLSTLTKVAGILVQGDDAFATLERTVTGLAVTQVRTALALAGVAEQPPAIPSVVRVAARIFGQKVDDTRENSEQLIAVLFGNGEDGTAFAAAMEVAEQFCHTTLVKCTKCPLNAICLTASAGDTRIAERPTAA